MKKQIVIIVTLLMMGISNQINAQLPTKAENVSPLLIGEQIPEVTLQNNEGKQVELHSLLKQKPTVLVFYRGGWCPFCNIQLSGLAMVEKQVLDLGYQIIAVSPDDYKKLQSTSEKGDVKYQLLSDAKGELIQKIGIGFQSSSKLNSSNILPVPTVMVVDKEGTIVFEYISPNYKERISEEMLLAVLKSIKK